MCAWELNPLLEEGGFEEELERLLKTKDRQIIHTPLGLKQSRNVETLGTPQQHLKLLNPTQTNKHVDTLLITFSLVLCFQAVFAVGQADDELSIPRPQEPVGT
jgi:hypothetical protein